MKNILLILLVVTSVCNAFAEGKKEVWVHITGFVNKPGRYKVSSASSPQDILKSCAGSSTFGSMRHVNVIRLARAGNEIMGITKREKTEVFYYDFRRVKSIPLHDGDLIFIPQKRVVGR